jgi:hypothetical protein
MAKAYSTHHNVISSNSMKRGSQRYHAFIISSSLYRMREDMQFLTPQKEIAQLESTCKIIMSTKILQ